MRKLLFLLLSMVLLPALIKAGPASPGIITDKQPDGSTIEYYLRGDEKIYWMESLDGYTLLINNSGYIVYAIQDAKKDLVPSEIIYRNTPTTKSVDSRMSAITKKMFYSESQINQMHKMWEVERTQTKLKSSSKSQYSGKIRVLCILVDFEDRPFTIENPKAKFEMLFNQRQYVGTIDNPAYGSIRDFFLENSYGKVDIQFDFIGPYRAGKMSDYKAEGEYTNTNLSKLGKWLIANKIKNEPNLDLSIYANESQTINRTHIIFAGEDQANAGIANGFAWAHQYGFGWGGSIEPPIPGEEPYDCVSKVDGKTYTFKGYSCSSELTHNWRNKVEKYISTIGTPTHELAHLLFNSRDYYDIYGIYEGTGQWDLMGGGSHNHLTDNFYTKVIYGNCPAHINMYEKIRLGWVEPQILNTTGNYSMVNSAENPIAYIYQKGTTYKTFTSLDDIEGEFYILENKQKKGFDRALINYNVYNEPYFNGGLLIYRAHPDAKSTWYINSSYPQKLYPICASSSNQFPSQVVSSYGDIDGVGCVFGNGYNKFTDEGTPSAKTILSYTGGSVSTSSNTEKPITEISNSNDIVTFKFENPNLPIEKYHPEDKEFLRDIIRQNNNLSNYNLQPSDTLIWNTDEKWIGKLDNQWSLYIKWNESLNYKRIVDIDVYQADNIKSIDFSLLADLKICRFKGLEDVTSLNFNNKLLEILEMAIAPKLLFVSGLEYSPNLSDIIVYETNLSDLDLTELEHLDQLLCTGNKKLSSVKLPENIIASGNFQIYSNNNNFRFSTLPDFSLYSPNTYWGYDPQTDIDGGIISGIIDLSSEYNIRGTISNFEWYANRWGYYPVTPLTSTNGQFTFSPDLIGVELSCRITNALYPDLTVMYTATWDGVSKSIRLAKSNLEAINSFVYPTLARPTEALTVNMTNQSSPATVEVYNILGSGQLISKYKNILSGNIIEAPSTQGVYVIRITCDGVTESHRIIVK